MPIKIGCSGQEKYGGGGLITKSCPTLVTPWTVACQTPLSIGFSRQEYYSGLLFPSPGDLSDTGIEPRSPALQADSLPTELQGKPCVKYAAAAAAKSLQSCPTLVTPWTAASQAPLSVGFSRQEYYSGLPWPPPGDLPKPGIEPRSSALQADSLPSELSGKP